MESWKQRNIVLWLVFYRNVGPKRNYVI